MAEVTARKRGSKWEYRFEGISVDGKRKQYSKSGFRTKKEAMTAGTEAFSRFNRTGLILEPKRMSISDLIDWYLETFAKQHVTETTYQTYRKDAENMIKPAIGKYDFSSARKDVFVAFFNSLAEKYARKTINLTKTVLNSAYEKAIDMQWIESNPLDRVKIPENTVVHAKKDILTQEDFNSIIALLADEPDIQLPFQIGWFTGMRVNEVLSLTWDDVDIEAGIIHVRKQIVLGKVRVPKTASSIRDIPIGDTLKNILSNAKARQSRMRAEYREHYSTYAVFEGTVIKSEKDSFDYVCRKENGEPISRNSLQWRISWTSKAIGRPYSFHVLRHSHATLLIEAHAPLKAVQGRLGHASPKITMEIYSHVTRKQETEAMEIFERIAHGK